MLSEPIPPHADPPREIPRHVLEELGRATDMETQAVRDIEENEEHRRMLEDRLKAARRKKNGLIDQVLGRGLFAHRLKA